jgi:sulfur carrier protein ThiS
MTIFIDGQPIKDRTHLEQPIGSDAVIDIFQALSGG